MAQRGAELVDISQFTGSVLTYIDALNRLNNYRLELLVRPQIDSVLSELRDIFFNVKVMKTKARIVGVSKTMHFLLPNLVMPIDRSNILTLLYLNAPYSTDPKREYKWFTEIFREYHSLCEKLSLGAKDVDNIGWNTSIPKMIDNALIAFLGELYKGNVQITPITPTTPTL